MDRFEATQWLVAHLTDQPVISNLGPATGDLFVAGDRPLNFYMWGALGVTSAVGLGVALATPDRKVLILDGDGSLLMGLGTLATIADQAPKNLVHIVWDNSQWAETGGQPTHTATVADLAAIARGAGVGKALRVERLEEFQEAVRRALQEDGPWCIVARIQERGRKGFPPNEPEANLLTFRRALKSS
ncbi:MAG: hypothetical protein HYU29_08290 [Chloroflexi bacterium]|nr:hypothetical protein [Chloroflexota bacterium]